MRYTPLSAETYILHRKNFVAQLQPNAIAILNSNDIMPTNADGTMPFRQNNDLLYLSGIDQEETILVLFPDAKDESMREILFVLETNEEIAIWEGAKLTKQQATAQSGIQNVIWVKDFHSVLQQLMADAEIVYLPSNEHTRSRNPVETREDRFRKWMMQKYPLHTYKRTAPILNRLRSVKSAEEIKAIQQACAITEKGFRRLLSFVKPGVWEYEIEAELLHEFIRNRSKGFAYTPIIAAGANSCVLHYIDNNQQCLDGQIILLDVAAEYANYASDLTRVIPVNGRYTDRQKQVYNAVLRVMKAATQMLRPGTTIRDYHVEVGKVMEHELLQLGLISKTDIQQQDPKWPAYKKYFMHGTSHFLGLDVHDVGYFNEPIKPGMVFTCEPGIYIREEGIGIRLENDILVTNEAPMDLMAGIPLEIDEIETLMNS